MEIAEASTRLVHNDHVFINLANNTFQWVDIQWFRLPETVAGDALLLGSLISHDLYGCDYAGGDPGANPDRHGPYWRERITPDCFDRTDADSEQTLLRGWAEQYAPLSVHLLAVLEHQLYQPLLAAERIYRLRDLGRHAFHDWGGVQHQFHELVLINQAARTLTLAVATDD